MSQDKKESPNYALRMPPKRDGAAEDVDTAELLMLTARGDPEQAAALISWIGQDVDANGIQKMLLDAASWIGSYFHESDSPRRLAWCDTLIQRGGDPFAAEGVNGERGYQASLAERLVRAGFWDYLSDITDRAGPSGAASAKAALERFESTNYMANETRRQALAGGPRGVAFVTRVGFDPNALVKKDPWVFQCEDGETLLAFAAAGADLDAKDQFGRSLEERVSERPAGRARQGMLDVLLARQSAAPIDAKQALKSMASLALNGNYKEISKMAEVSGIDLAKAKTEAGSSFLEIALLNANWSLASSLMSQAKADPAAPSLLAGIPTGALALWGPPPFGKKPTKAALNHKAECLALAFSEQVMSWRAPDGSPLLETCSRLAPEERKHLVRAGQWFDEAAKAAILAEPLNPQEPLWVRLSALGQPLSLVAHAAASREEPWLFKGQGILATLLVGRGNERVAFWENGESPLNALQNAINKSTKRSKDYTQLFSLPQLALAFEGFWELVAQDQAKGLESGSWNSKAAPVASQMQDCLRFCARLDTAGAIPAMDYEALSGLIQEGFDPARNLGKSASYWAERFIRERRYENPKTAVSLMLDLLALDAPEAIAAADAAWQDCKSFVSADMFPKDHRVFDSPPTSERLTSSLWESGMTARREPPKVVDEPPARSARRL